MKKILILDGHPDHKSYCSCVSEAYHEGARAAGLDVQKINIRDLKFNPILHYGYRKAQDLEVDLLKAQEQIKWCEHLVIITPVWWGGLPGLFKGFIDRTFIRGFSHYFDTKIGRPMPLLKGRSAHVIYTQGTPSFISRLIKGDFFWKTLKRAILKFCGFSSIKRTYLGSAKSNNAKGNKRRKDFLIKVEKMGSLGK